MIVARSLSMRLATVLFGVLYVGAFFVFVGDVLWKIGFAASNDFSLDSIAERSTYDLVIDSLVRAPDGSVSIEPSETLRALSERTPTLRYAVFDPTSEKPLPGSSTELHPLTGAALTQLRSLNAGFKRVGDSRSSGAMALWNTPLGDFVVSIYGYRFERDQVAYWVIWALKDILTWQGPVYILAAFVIMGVIWMGLAPLRAIEKKLRSIDFDTLDQRLPEQSVPTEFAPFVQAVNETLGRLSATFLRQRRFAANAAHQLCTPIAILRARLDDPHDEGLRTDLRRDLRQLQAIVEQLLVSARLAERGVEMEEKFDLVALVKSKVADYVPLMIENGKLIEFDGPDTPIPTRGDRRAIASMTANLIDNALRAEPPGGIVRVGLTPEAKLLVIDHGTGVSASDRDAIFEPFWSKSETTNGTGLGLSIVKEIVTLHGGSVSVEETLGGGATFIVCFAPSPGEVKLKLIG